MICTIITASALILGPVSRPQYHTVDFFDRQIQVTERVLNRSICKDIERVQAPDADQMSLAKTEGQKKALRDRADVNGKRNAIAVSNHCKASPRVSAKRECDLN
jgi:hypothetical protein